MFNLPNSSKKSDPDTAHDEVILPTKVYTSDDAAKLLGISGRTLRSMLGKGTIPGKRIGTGWRVLGQSLIDYMQKA